MKTRILLIAFVLTSILSCKEGEISPNIDGEYSGTFYYGTLYGTIQEAPAQLSIKNGRFSMPGTANRLPAGGKGSFAINDKNNIVFSDENVWTADFNWALILNGKYSFETKSDSLNLNKISEGNGGINPTVIYYKLKRLK